MNRSTRQTGFIIPIAFLAIQATALAGSPPSSSAPGSRPSMPPRGGNPSSAVAKPPPRASTNYEILQADERLKGKFRLNANKPNLEELMSRLAENTDLKFTADPGLLKEQPDFKSFYLETDAASLMSNIASRYDKDKGVYWAKTADGYNLTSPATQVALAGPGGGGSGG